MSTYCHLSLYFYNILDLVHHHHHHHHHHVPEGLGVLPVP